MKKIFFVLLFLGLLSCAPQSEKQDLLFFYFESCPSCDDYKKAVELSESLEIIQKGKTWEARSFNLISKEAKDNMMGVIQEKGLPDISRSLPILIMGNEYINGYDAIEEAIKKALEDFKQE